MVEKPDRDCVHFGLRLKDLRKKRGWSQEDLALEAGMDRSYVGDIERGARNISLINICKLARTLGVPGKELFNFLE